MIILLLSQFAPVPDCIMNEVIGPRFLQPRYRFEILQICSGVALLTSCPTEKRLLLKRTAFYPLSAMTDLVTRALYTNISQK